MCGTHIGATQSVCDQIGIWSLGGEGSRGLWLLGLYYENLNIWMSNHKVYGSVRTFLLSRKWKTITPSLPRSPSIPQRRKLTLRFPLLQVSSDNRYPLDLSQIFVFLVLHSFIYALSSITIPHSLQFQQNNNLPSQNLVWLEEEKNLTSLLPCPPF